MKKQYPYSNDKEFLSKIDALRIKEQWVKITLLEYSSEVPLENIEGKVTGGNLNKTGDSSVRCTCSLSCVVDTFKYNPDDIKSSYSISKKIYLELGITNDTDNYPNEEIIWFPQGVFFITNFAIAASATGAASINLQFKDKMAQLDGTVGGVLPSTVRFDIVTTIVDGIVHTDKVLVYDIIMEAVNHFGGEDLSNIIIDDIPTKAKRIVKWMGSEPVWIYPIVSNDGKISYDICFTSDLNEKQTAHTPVNSNGKIIGAKEYQINQDIGYVYEDFIYDEELTFDAGSKVTDVLDKIKGWLGNYEYFYDEQGQFHFQEIKNYLNNSQSAYIWEKILGTDDSDYLYESTEGKSVYTFDDNINLISITNTPVYENIKNDFIVEGVINNNNNIKRTCRYHLVIDDKPTITADGYDNILIYTDPLSHNTTIASPKIITPVQSNQEWTWSLPEFAEDGQIYGLLDEPQTFTFKKILKDMNDFATSYDSFINQENDLGNNENSYSLTEDIENYLFNLLEKYMGYNDTSSYKKKYRDVIFTLARQLCRYNVNKRASSLETTIEYYEDLYSVYILDVSEYSEVVSDKSWCGCLLQLLYNLFSDINPNHTPVDEYKDMSYWPAINKTIPGLWVNMQSSNDSDELRRLRKDRCSTYINDTKIKQKQLNVLIEQYIQIVNNYNIQITALQRNNGSTDLINSLTTKRNAIQNQLNNYESQQSICNERLTILYAILTALGSSELGDGETYYNVDVSIPVRKTSFWYYNNDDAQDTYGWNELTWYQYYCNKTNPTAYYPDGLGSMTYINYSMINWNTTNFTNSNCPSMNRYSSWYKNFYIDYAIEHELPYFDEDKGNTYIPINWRTELLLRGLRAEENGIDPGHYYQELKLNWPTIYDFKTEQLIPSSIDYIDYFVGKTGVMFGNTYDFGAYGSMTSANLEEIDDNARATFKLNEEADVQNFLLNYENGSYYYFFDMIDSSSPTWGEYSVNNIGRRTNVNVSDSVNCIFAPDIPNYAFFNTSGLTMQERRKQYADLQGVAEDIIQITDIFYNNFATGGSKQSAYEQIKYDLQQHTSYQNIVSVTAIPCFYLEPNVRVKLNDHSTNTFGDYVIKTISISLGTNSNMSVSMSKAMERI